MMYSTISLIVFFPYSNDPMTAIRQHFDQLSAQGKSKELDQLAQELMACCAQLQSGLGNQRPGNKRR